MLTGSVAEKVANEKKTLPQKDATFTCRIFVAPTAVETVGRRDCLASDSCAWIRQKWGILSSLEPRPSNRARRVFPPSLGEVWRSLARRNTNTLWFLDCTCSLTFNFAPDLAHERWRSPVINFWAEAHCVICYTELLYHTFLLVKFCYLLLIWLCGIFNFKYNYFLK